MPILFAALIVAIQISDSYLRYLALRGEMTSDERKNLLRNYFVTALVVGAIYAELFARVGITAPAYKFALIFGWIPWVAVSMLTVRRDFAQQFFVFGMATIWSLMQHNWSAIIVVSLFELTSEIEVILHHATLYPLLFLICLPIEIRCFTKILPPKKFFEDYGKIVAIFPLVMSLGVIILWAQEPTIHTWQERLSRFYLPFAFFFFYRHTMITSKQIRDRKLTAQNLRRMKDQLTSLGEYNQLMQENREQVAVMRHDLRHSYRLIYAMLRDGKISSAKDYIASQEKLLGKTAMKNFCPLPLINAALSIYIRRAEHLGFQVRHKINLPPKISTDESDLALLISNLLENAINATIHQPPGRQKISVVMQNVGGQFVIEVANFYDAPVAFDEKKFPRTSREGHGLGMASIKNFSDKYNAYTDFSQENGVFKVTMYWLS